MPSRDRSSRYQTAAVCDSITELLVKNCDNDRLHCTLILVVTPPRLCPHQARPPDPKTRNTCTTGLQRLSFPIKPEIVISETFGEILQLFVQLVQKRTFGLVLLPSCMDQDSANPNHTSPGYLLHPSPLFVISFISFQFRGAAPNVRQCNRGKEMMLDVVDRYTVIYVLYLFRGLVRVTVCISSFSWKRGSAYTCMNSKDPKAKEKVRKSERTEEKRREGKTESSVE